MRHYTRNKVHIESPVFYFRCLAEMQALLPVHPDEQLRFMKEKIEKELSKSITEDELKRIEYYMFKV